MIFLSILIIAIIGLFLVMGISQYFMARNHIVYAIRCAMLAHPEHDDHPERYEGLPSYDQMLYDLRRITPKQIIDHYGYPYIRPDWTDRTFVLLLDAYFKQSYEIICQTTRENRR